jgi:hypothetical protein
LLSLGFAVALAMMAVPASAGSGGDPMQPFFGTYRGRGIADPDLGASARDLDVTIAPVAGGFSVTWTTVAHDVHAAPRTKTYTVSFEPTGRAGIYGSRMRTDMFGKRVPDDPLRGAPYVWARLRDKTLSVYALLITADGGYEMQVYHRTLVEDGLALKFLRLREGEAVRTVTAPLIRVAP